ncbi:hypothetical protein CHLRE_14g633903v5 [Chlamydomonas reinhardtii]|uniref:Uncharacterized protein n=1 Tax=Chlamydomonas reinhardtii TaxID=3055 RepID=A0A2K3CYY2_CHLRE|nr:uncharacterized protein CHLRE_14g633903v5 [Chlamydomonas reinhardtii]PNW73495.1 hypothetical protein CHLRE_14g633903v5 [Chlamydomonas reinhardtii]
MGSSGSSISLQCGALHSFKITLAYRGGRRGGTAFNPFGYRLGGWPQRIKHKPRVVLAADVQVLPYLPKEVVVVLPALRGWPPGRYLLREHRVACGCGACREAQGYAVEGSEAGGAGAGESGEDEEDEEEEEEAEDLQQETQVDEEASTRHGDTGARAGIAGPAAAGGPGRAPRRYKRRLRMDERGGFWAPHRYVEHAAGVRLGGGRQPAGVPPLRSQDWIRFQVPLPGRGQGQGPGGQSELGTRHVELTVSELCRELGYRWQHRKCLPPPPPLPPPHQQ